MPELSFTVEYDYSTRAAIEVTVTLKQGELQSVFEASVDTGAAFCIFNRGIAESLNIDVESGDAMRLSTAIGLFTAYGHTLTLETLGLEFETRIYFAEHEGLPRNVLGRKGWLDRVRLGLIEADAKLFVSRYDD